ncbi:MAG: sodium:proton antiporter [Planctomycetes bacterium]|nr:sodium:proton antiporter [Planctomycetota bacterium]
MSVFQALSVTIALAAGASYVNRRFLRLHPTIGVMAVSLAGAILLAGLDAVGLNIEPHIERFFDRLDFSALLLDTMLGLLLFAGAFHVDLDDLLGRKVEISVFALFGVVATAFIVASATFGLSQWAGLELSFVECLLFGALISPTDPIAVLAILERVGGPRRLRTDICGESLFNDGIGVVMFVTVMKVYTGQAVNPGTVVGLFVMEAAGGLLLGVLLGKLASWLVRSAGEAHVETLLGLAVATGGYALANAIHCSGAIAMVVSGTLVGRAARTLREGDRRDVNAFWSMIDEVGNMILFTVVGLELLVIARAVEPDLPAACLAASAAVPIVLVGRLVAVTIPLNLLRLRYDFYPRATTILTWGGLRGGLPLAMALSLPMATPARNASRNTILCMTYGVVLISIFLQGLTISPMVKKLLPTEE